MKKKTIKPKPTPKPTPTKCPHCGHALSGDEVKTIWGTYCVHQREHHGAGPGRPRKAKRCPCGAMSLIRAKYRNHQCVAPSTEKKLDK